MRQTATNLGIDCMLGRISGGICDNATAFNRLDMARLVRRVEAQCQFQDTLTNLKDKIARKATGRVRAASSDGSVELYYKAS
jgi:hypothetical protein